MIPDAAALVRDHLARLGGLDATPVRFADGRVAWLLVARGLDPSSPLVPMDGALASGALRIAEQPRPSVPSVTFHNTGNRPVYVPAGSLVVGGGQNRVVLDPHVVEPGARSAVEVRCVEQGRWQPGRGAFRETAPTPHFLRVAAARRGHVTPPPAAPASAWRRDVLGAFGRAAPPALDRSRVPLLQDQSAVWASVRSYLDARGARSSTGDLTAGTRAARGSTARWASETAGARGVCVTDRGAVAWLESTGSASLAASIVDGCLAGLRAEAERAEGAADPEPWSILAALARTARIEARPGTGAIVAIEDRASGLVGHAVVREGEVLHVVLGPSEGGPW